jgi:hypothetical protein
MAMPARDSIVSMTHLELDSLAKIIAERMRELSQNGLEPLHDEPETKANNLGYSPSNKQPISRALPPGSAEIFRQWQAEARLAKFTKTEYAGAFDDFWSALAKGDCVLHALLCQWTRLLREENRVRSREIGAERQQLPSAA